MTQSRRKELVEAISKANPTRRGGCRLTWMMAFLCPPLSLV
jgi:hypothetical protein